MAWTLIYHHDKNGTSIAGSKSDLISKIQNGTPVRVIVDRSASGATNQWAFEPSLIQVVGRTPIFDVMAIHTMPRNMANIGLPTANPPDSSVEIIRPFTWIGFSCSTTGRVRFEPLIEASAPPAAGNMRYELKWLVEV